MAGNWTFGASLTSGIDGYLLGLKNLTVGFTRIQPDKFHLSLSLSDQPGTWTKPRCSHDAPPAMMASPASDRQLPERGSVGRTQVPRRNIVHPKPFAEPAAIGRTAAPFPLVTRHPSRVTFMVLFALIWFNFCVFIGLFSNSRFRFFGFYRCFISAHRCRSSTVVDHRPVAIFWLDLVGFTWIPNVFGLFICVNLCSPMSIIDPWLNFIIF
ncbi:MAG: hypothetical protein P4N60_01725 [Verrucomicrobiae bacterium]|nr:hypothetical protein [Verrucomicrobiae bacterium]